MNFRQETRYFRDPAIAFATIVNYYYRSLLLIPAKGFGNNQKRDRLEIPLQNKRSGLFRKGVVLFCTIKTTKTTDTTKTMRTTRSAFENNPPFKYHRLYELHIKFSKILLCNLCNALHDHYIFYSLKIFICKGGLNMRTKEERDLVPDH